MQIFPLPFLANHGDRCDLLLLSDLGLKLLLPLAALLEQLPLLPSLLLLFIEVFLLEHLVHNRQSCRSRRLLHLL